MPSHSEASLKAGLTALKQGDYQTAKTILEDIVSSHGDRTVVIQAEIGLVVVYTRIGEVATAIALCETLVENERPQVKEWAERSLEQIKKRYQNDDGSTADVTGFIPWDNSSPMVESQQSQTEDVQIQERQNADNTSIEQTPARSLRVPTFGGNQTRGWLASAASTPRASVPKTPSLPIPPPPNSGIIVNQEKIKPPTIYWRQAGRAKVWQPLPKRGLKLLCLVQAGTCIALFWVIKTLLVSVMRFINDAFVKLPFLEPLQLLYRDPTSILVVLIFVLFCLSPWLLDRLLTKFYGQRELEKDILHRHSKETLRVLQRYCQQRGWRTPKLFVLPMTAPVALCYGHLPRTGRIVVSQGLLEQLTNDEIATIYASQLGQIAHWDCAVMSLLLVVTIPIYQLYQLLGQWGDTKTQPIWRGIFSVLTSLVYGLWWLLTATGLWLSQRRLYWCDRVAAEVTGNPNALVRALLKMAIGIAGDVQKQEHTSWQLESLNLVIPVGYKQSLWLGSMAGYTTFESLLMWDCVNPYRWWFVINNTHPLIGDRALRLCKIARLWHVDPELYLESQQPLRIKPQSFLLQIAPWLGIPLGVAFGGLIWLIWQTLFALKLLNLKWIYEDWNFINGCMLIGFSIGVLLRINYFFSNIKPATVQTDDQLPNLLTNPASIPIDSIGVRLVGKLLGRRGTSNCLAQDLVLQSHTGLVKLHHISWLGQHVNPQELIGRQITVTGWLRRGATPWIDVQTLQTQGGKIVNSPHPIWSIVLAVTAEVWGAYILLRG